jgi:acetyl esterase/lipase
VSPVRIDYGPEPDQFGELWLPPGHRRAGTVVIIHGGFWRAAYDLSLGRPLAADLVARGYAVWNLEYRRVGAGGGWKATFADVAAGIDRLADLDVDPTAVAAVGHSAGGHLAAWAAGRDRLPPDAPGGPPRVAVTAVLPQAAVLALVEAAERGVGGTAAPDLMGGAPEAVAERYRLGDPLAVAPLAVPVRCVHSRADVNVPFDQSVRYVEAAGVADTRLVEVPGEHMDHVDPDSTAWTVVVEALPELLSS